MRKRVRALSLALALMMIVGVTAVYLIGPPAAGSEGTPPPGDNDDQAGPSGGVTDPNDPAPPTGDVAGTTTLLVSKETVGFWERAVTYDWSIDKYVLGSEEVLVTDDGRLGHATVPQGETVTVDYLVVADRYVVDEIEYMGVRGYVCVRNTGGAATESLAIVDHVQAYDVEVCGYVDIAVFGVDTSGKPVLQPGEEHAYYFEYSFEAVAAAEYRNMACVSICNYEGFDGVKHAVPAFDDFEMPSQPHLIETDETASVIDMMWCPENFDCVATASGPWVLTGSDEIAFSADITNLDAGCEQERCLANKVTLTELDCCQVREDCAYVNLLTGPCPCLTTIEVEKSAELRWEKTVEYDWTVEKGFEVLVNGQAPDLSAVATPDLVLGEGQTAKVCYYIDAAREVADVTMTFWLEGCVRVCNTGCCPTEGLVIHDVFAVKHNGEWHEFDFAVSTEDMPVLGPGECYDYKYSVDVTEFLLSIFGGENDVDAQSERSDLYMVNKAFAGITNFDGQDGLYYVKDKVEVALPEPEVTYIDETATLTDLETFPDGFEMDIVSGPWYLDGPDTVRFCKNITNMNAECGRTYYVNDTARLVEDDTGEVREDQASVVVETPECERGITLDISKTVNAAWNRTVVYDWELEKSVNRTALELGPGESGYLNYTLTATRSVESRSESIEVWGTVTVTNNGPFATQGLKVIDTLYIEIEGMWIELEVLDLTAQKSSLDSGETFVYYYSTDVTHEIAQALGGDLLPNDLSAYGFKNVAAATVTNYAGHLGAEWGVDATKNFEITTPSTVETDETATLTDLFDDLPEGFVITGIEDGPWYLTGSNEVSFDVTVYNEDAECGSTYYLNNTAKLVEDDSGTEHYDDASVVITTPECECGGCTLTIGFWKNHDGSGPQADEITPLIQAAGGTIWLGTPGGAKSVAVTTAAQAGAILAQDEADNGINKLYAQMLASKLNILHGACDDAVDQTIAAADAFLATHDAADWDGLSAAEQQQVLAWKDVFDDYNNGIIGPGHCE